MKFISDVLFWISDGLLVPVIVLLILLFVRALLLLIGFFGQYLTSSKTASAVNKELKALELPGLWNGSMSDWNTLFVEVPSETFNPVKTVLDLLRPAHQPER